MSEFVRKNRVPLLLMVLSGFLMGRAIARMQETKKYIPEVNAMKVEDLREVSLYYEDRINTFLIHKDEVQMFVEASKSLHVSPGVNPHNGMKAERILLISCSTISSSGPYWWTSPSLQAGRKGARILKAQDPTTLYVDPDHLKTMKY